ncbi:MAG: hypothetical protein OWS03_04350 [Alicyclobacillaceae bacterium]|nr:hypothetical protein [Alicyclobacillaceae bacterium]
MITRENWDFSLLDDPSQERILFRAKFVRHGIRRPLQGPPQHTILLHAIESVEGRFDVLFDHAWVRVRDKESFVALEPGDTVWFRAYFDLYQAYKRPAVLSARARVRYEQNRAKQPFRLGLHSAELVRFESLAQALFQRA